MEDKKEKLEITEEAETEPKEQAEAEEAETEPKEQAEAADKKKSNLKYNIVIAIGVCMLIGGVAAVVQKYKGDADTKAMYSDLADEFVTVGDGTEDTELDWGFDWVSADGSSSYTSTVWYQQISVDFDGLNGINEDVVGWIYQENGDISYPILYSGDNDTYLRKTLYKVSSTSGSIFLGGDNNPDMTDPLVMVYGHNMKNGSMFGSLKKYKNEEDYYEEHQYFQIYTENGMAYRYQIYAYFDIKDTETAMEDLLFYDSEDSESAIVTEVILSEGDETEEPVTTEVILNEENTYAAYLETIAERSVLDTDIEVTTEDQVLGLWTCSSSSGNRFLVFAVKVDEHNFNEETGSQTSDLEQLDR